MNAAVSCLPSLDQAAVVLNVGFVVFSGNLPEVRTSFGALVCTSSEAQAVYLQSMHSVTFDKQHTHDDDDSICPGSLHTEHLIGRGRLARIFCLHGSDNMFFLSCIELRSFVGRLIFRQS